MGKYSEYDRASLSFGWRLLLWVLAIIVVGGLISWGVLAIRAATSETKGNLDAQIQINEGKNQIASQELFERMYASIKANDANLDVAAAALKRSPSEFNQTNYDGLKMICNTSVQEYNAEARKISRGKWMSPDLPYEIDQTDPRFDCMETGAVK